MKFIFCIIALLIVYGSLFPFHLSTEPVSESGLKALFDFNVGKTGFSDLVANIILFIPFGIFIKAAFPSKRPTFSFINFMLIGFVFAFLIQAMQLWTTNRLPWGGDAIWNSVGCAIGLIIHSFMNLKPFKQLHSLEGYKQISFALALALIVMKLAPFAPSIDFGVLKENTKALILDPSIDIYWTFENTVFWLVAFYFLSITNLQWSRFRLLVLTVCSVLALKFIIVSSNINLSQLLAGGLALLIWRFLPIRNAPFLAGLLLLAIFGNGLYPFETSATMGKFNWLPFSGSMGGNILLNIIAMTKKLVFYGSFVWLLYLINKNLVKATVICALVLLFSEFLQTLFTNSVSESTDVLLAVIIAFIFSQKLKYSAAQSVELSANSKLEHTDKYPQQKTFNANSTNTFEKVSTPLINISLSQVKTITKHPYIGGLDGLRAVAALAVFFVHFQQFSKAGGSLGYVDFERLMINGNTGVGLFFVLSGFLLSVPFWREISVGTFPKVRDYLINRVVRIIPIYYCTLFGILALHGFQSSDINFNNIISHVFFLHNLKDHQVMTLNPPFWTLAVEFQFYLFLPLLFLLFAKLGMKRAQVLCVLLVPTIYIGYRLLMQYLEGYQNWPIQIPLIWPFGVLFESVKGLGLTYSLMAHLPHFLIGVVAASFYKKSTALNKRQAYFAELVFWVSAVSVFFILATPLDDKLQLAYGRYNFPFVPVLLGLIVFSTPYTRYAKSLLEWAPIKWLGIISYGLYIFHWPIQQASVQLLQVLGLSANEHMILFAGMSFVITVIFAHFSYLIIEAPILKRFKKHKKTNGRMDPHMKNQSNSNMSNLADNQNANIQSHSEQSTPSRNKKPKANKMNKAKILLPVLIGIVVLAAVLFVLKASSNTSEIKQVFWAGPASDVMIFDHHAHTTYSDGSLSVEALSELAFFKGCDAFSITDHSQNAESFSEAKLAEIKAMREMYPGMLIFAGIELGLPSYNGREHVNIITTPEYESSVLPAVLNALRKPKSDQISAKQKDTLVFSAIGTIANAPENTIAIYNHPSRKDQSAEENLLDFQHWNTPSNKIVAFAGAPGHQNSKDIGSYEDKFKPIHRWDPVVAEVGGTWDQLLAEGQRVWGAIASSDYHGDHMDYGPCAFSRIHVSVPSKDYAGLIKGVKAGTFWADHGKLLGTFDFNVILNSENNKFTRIYPGGSLKLIDSPHVLSIAVNIVRKSPYENDFMRADIISNCGHDDAVLSSTYMPPEQNQFQSLIVLAEENNCFVRARIVRETVEGNDLSAYSNPIFIEF